MPDSANLFKSNISSIVTLLVGLFVFVSIPSQIEIFEDGSMNPVTARTLPYLISSGIILLSLSMIVSSIFGTPDKKESTSEALPQEKTSYVRVFYAFAAIALWIVVLTIMSIALPFLF